MLLGVVEFLGAADLSRFSVACRDCQVLARGSWLWKALVLGTLDPLNALGHGRVEYLAKHFSWRRLAQQLSSQRCELCGATTVYFFVLTCSRICAGCFSTDDSVAMCTLSYATAHFLLDDRQANALPAHCVAEHNASSDPPQTLRFREQGDDAAPPVLLTTISAARASAAGRFGSLERFEKELLVQKDSARRAYSDARRAHYCASWKLRSPASEEDSTLPPSSALEALPLPEAPRILGIQHEINYVAVNQGRRVLRGPKWGHFAVVSKAFFEETGVRVFVDGGQRWEDGRALREALERAPEGAVVVVRGFVTLRRHLYVRKVVMLVGDAACGGVVESAGADYAASVVVLSPCVVLSNMTFRREIANPSKQTYFEDLDWNAMAERGWIPNPHGNWREIGGRETQIGSLYEFLPPPVVGAALCIATPLGALVESCVVGPCDQGPGLVHQSGSLLAKGCTFLGDSAHNSVCRDRMDVNGCLQVQPFPSNASATATLLDNDLSRVCIWGAEACFPQSDAELQRHNRVRDGTSWRNKVVTFDADAAAVAAW